MFFWLVSDEPFKLSLDTGTQAVGSAHALASALFPVMSGGIPGLNAAYDPAHSYSRIFATNTGQPQTVPDAFTDSDVLHPAGIYNFQLDTIAEDYANDGSPQAAAGFSSLSFHMTATVVPEQSTAMFGAIGLLGIFSSTLSQMQPGLTPKLALSHGERGVCWH